MARPDTTTLLPGGFDPSQYQYQPTVSNIAQPSQAVLPLSPQQDFLRQYGMGQLMGPNQTQDYMTNMLNAIMTNQQFGQAPGMDFLKSMIGGAQPGGGDPTAAGMAGIFGGNQLDVANNPVMQNLVGALGNTAQTNLQRGIGDILSRSNLQGGFGGSRQALMEGQATADTMKGLNQTVADLMNTAQQAAYGRQLQAGSILSGEYQQAAGRQLSAADLANQQYQQVANRQIAALPFAQQAANQPIQNTMQALQLAGMPQDIANANNAYVLQQLQQMNDQRFLPLQIAQSIFGQQMGQTIPVVTPQTSNLAGVGSILSGTGSLLGAQNPFSTTTQSIGQGIGSGIQGMLASIPLLSQ